MDERIKKLLNELGEAINRAVSESPDVDYVMKAIRKAGYEPWLLLEAKVAVENKRADTEPAVDSNQAFFSDQQDEDRDAVGALDDNLTPEDRRFLKYLKIDY